jgi:hypothetical protein
MSKLRKAFVVSVMFMTVLSMSVVTAPQAGAAASAGDLIKMDGLSSVYYLGADGKRYVFPNETTYFSWYEDFSGVVTVPQSELESYPLGANVTIRPGTYLVKITTDPKVYAVEPGGSLVWVSSESAAQTLYGSDWASRVVDVPDAFFTNYTVSSEELDGTAYPTGSLIKKADSADIYYIDADGKARKIADDAAFTANRFRNEFVITTTLDIPTAGTDITGAESDLIDTSSGAGGVAGAGTGLTVALASDTPASVSIPSGGTLVPFLTVNFTASSDGDVTIQNLVLTRTGTGATTDFSGGYLYDGDTRLTNLRSVNSTDHTISFNALNYTVPAGSTKSLTLKMNAATGTVNGSHAFKIASASDVTTDGAAVSGSFPIQGNTMTYSNAVSAATVTLTSSDDLPDVKIGETDVKILEFNIANDSQEIVQIYRIRLKNNGTAGNNAINNLSLELDGTVVDSGVSMSDKYVDFTLDTPFEIKKGKTITATVRGDVITDINKTVQLYLKNVADIDARGTAYGDFYSATITNTSLNTTGADNVTIKGSEINVSFDGPQAQDIKDDTDDLVLANFNISTQQDVNIETIRVVLTMGSDTASDNLDNIEMVDSAHNLAFTVADPTSATTTHNIDFENILLEAGVDYNFEIRGDVPDGATTGQTYKVTIDFSSNFTARFQDEDETLVTITDLSQTSLTGKTMTVAAPAVTLSKVSTNNATYVENADKVLLYKGRIAANSVSDLTISKMTFGATFGTINSIDDAFNKLYLYTASDDLGTPLDTETSLTDATSVAFSGFTLSIPKGTSNAVDIVVRGDVKDSPTAGTMALHWGTGSATTTKFTVKDSDSDALAASQYTVSMTDGQTTTIASKGTFTMTIDTNMTGLNQNQNVLAGTEMLVGRIKLTADKEDANLEDFTLYNLQGTATGDDIAALNIYEDAGMTTKLGTAALDSSKRATFEDININIPTTGVKYIYIGAQLQGIDYSSSPGADSTATAARTIKLDIASTTNYTVKATGVSTGEVLSNTGVASTTQTNTSTILGATISAITTDFANGLLTNGTARDIFSFKITAPSSDNIDYDGTPLTVKLATTTFTVASTTNIDLASFKVERVGGANGEKAAKVDGGSATSMSYSAGTFAINFPATYGTNSDLEIEPGQTVEYIIRATISNVGANESLQVTLENLSSNVNYTHNTGSAGTDGADISAVYTLLPGVTSVRGGALTN